MKSWSKRKTLDGKNTQEIRKTLQKENLENNHTMKKARNSVFKNETKGEAGEA